MKSKNRIVKIIQLAWLLVCFYIGQRYFNQDPFSGEAFVAFIEMMSIVTFPIGYLAIYIVRAMVWVLPLTLNNGIAGSPSLCISLWILMTVFGYFQWFYLVPLIGAKIGREKS